MNDLMRLWWTRCAAGVAILAGLALVGCGGSKKPYPTATVAGAVKLNGEAIKTGTITFMPTDGKASSEGGHIQNGKYSVEVPLGPKSIQISAVQGTGRMRKTYDTPDSPTEEITEEIVPACYNVATTLEHNVTANKADLNFDENRGRNSVPACGITVLFLF